MSPPGFVGAARIRPGHHGLPYDPGPEDDAAAGRTHGRLSTRRAAVHATAAGRAGHGP